MYLPEHFKEVSEAEIASVMRAAPLACIVAQTEAGLIANHLPLLTVADGALVGHVALANDMHRLVSDGQEVLVIFGGEDGYVSPNFYPHDVYEARRAEAGGDARRHGRRGPVRRPMDKAQARAFGSEDVGEDVHARWRIWPSEGREKPT